MELIQVSACGHHHMQDLAQNRQASSPLFSRMMCEYRCKLDQLKPETRSEVGSHHFQVIASTCLQLRSLASCTHQKKVFEQVERLMILSRDYTEHIGPDPFPWPEDDAFLTVAPDTHCSRIEHSLLYKMEMWECSARKNFLENLETSVNLILDGMMEHGNFVFASHANLFWLFKQCQALVQDYYLMMCGLTATVHKIGTPPGDRMTFQGWFNPVPG